MRAVLRISGLCILVTVALSGHAHAQNDGAIVLETSQVVSALRPGTGLTIEEHIEE